MPTAEGEYRRTEAYHRSVHIKISLVEILSLFVNLLYLKLVLGLVIPLCGCSPAIPGLRRTLFNTEFRIMTIFMTSIPPSFYRSRRELIHRGLLDPNTGDAAAEYATQIEERISGSSQNTAVGDGGAVNKKNSPGSPLMQISSSISPAVRMSQGFSDRTGHPSMDLSNTISGSAVAIAGLSAVPTSASEYSVGLGKAGSAEKTQSKSSSDQAMVSASQFSKLIDTPQFSSADGRSITNESAPSEPHLAKVPIDMDGLRPSRSVESDPGRSAGDDSMEFSSMAAASHQLKGRGITSVRPLSEV